MKTNLRGKIREFVQSEEGKVGIKSPLTLGVTAGGLLLAHTVVGTPQAEAHWGPCLHDHHCHGGQICDGHVWIGNQLVGSCM